MPSRRDFPRPNPWLLTGLLFGVTVLAYLPCLRGAVLWDDSGHVIRPELRSLQGLWRIWFVLGASQQYYPVLHTAFWLERRWWGDSTLGYHLVNILLHAASARLLVEALRQLRGNPIAGTVEWLAGFIFALHPVCIESAAWISEQKNTLSGAFYLPAALALLKFEDRLQAGGRRAGSHCSV